MQNNKNKKEEKTTTLLKGRHQFAYLGITSKKNFLFYITAHWGPTLGIPVIGAKRKKR